MRVLARVMTLCAVALVAGLILAPNASAVVPEGSYLNTTEPLDVGGTLLQPGRYVIRVLPNIANRNLLQVTNEDGSKIYVTCLSIPHAIAASERQLTTEYVLYPAVEGTPRALRTWYAPGSTSHGGHDIVYPERRAMQLVAVVREPIVAYKDETNIEALPTAPLVVVTPEKKVIAYVEPKPVAKPVQVVAARELPVTASRLPLAATLGLALLGAAVGIRVFRMV